MVKNSLKAKKRVILGRKVKSLRRNGIIPGNVYGNKVKSTAVEINEKEFRDLYKEVGKTGLINLEIDKEVRPVLIHNVQIGAVEAELLHIDFLQVDLLQKVTSNIPVELIGESPAEKTGIGVLVLQVNSIEIEALPTDLPEKFVIDVSNLSEVDQAILVKDIKYDAKKIEVKIDKDQIVVKIEPPQKEEVVEPVTVVETPVEATTEGKVEGQNSEEKAPTEEKPSKE